MKHLKSLMAGMAALSLGLAACTSENPEMATVMDSGTNEGSNDAIYSSIRFHLPASRSIVKEGEEVGQDYENKVGSILVVLATKEGDNYSYLTYALSDASVSAPGNDATRHTVVFQEKENLISQAGKSVYVFAYCNPTEAIRSVITTPGNDKNTFFDAICNGDYESTWSANGFLMTNVQVLEKTLPGEEEIKTYNSASNALDLGTVDVIRSAVRFDYKDGSPKQADKTPKFGINTYAIYDAQVINPTDDDVVAKVHMTNVALVNMRNEFYYLPRTSDKGLCPGLTGMETTAIDSYVVTPADATYAYGLPAAIYHGDEAYKSLDWTSLDAIVSGTTLFPYTTLFRSRLGREHCRQGGLLYMALCYRKQYERLDRALNQLDHRRHIRSRDYFRRRQHPRERGNGLSVRQHHLHRHRRHSGRHQESSHFKPRHRLQQGIHNQRVRQQRRSDFRRSR